MGGRGKENRKGEEKKKKVKYNIHHLGDSAKYGNKTTKVNKGKFAPMQGMKTHIGRAEV